MRTFKLFDVVKYGTVAVHQNVCINIFACGNGSVSELLLYDFSETSAA